MTHAKMTCDGIEIEIAADGDDVNLIIDGQTTHLSGADATAIGMALIQIAGGEGDE